jgi:hypothetical protein
MTMAPDDQIKVDTKLGTLSATGPVMPVVVAILALIAGVVWYHHTEMSAVADDLRVHSSVMADYQKEHMKRLDTLIGIQCAILRDRNPRANQQGCF